MCGEQVQGAPNRTYHFGSPPRVRGTAAHPHTYLGLHGITPACAGNRHARFARCGRYQDHPRVCGEQPDARLCRSDHYGSPPRVRGTALASVQVVVYLRITPACAGNRPTQGARLPLSQDHPRVCGEQRPGEIAYIGEQGSPPRVRGTVMSAYGAGLRERITPACAGNRPIAGVHSPG